MSFVSESRISGHSVLNVIEEKYEGQSPPETEQKPTDIKVDSPTKGMDIPMLSITSIYTYCILRKGGR